MSDALNKEETQELIDANPHLGVIDRHAESVSKAKLVLIIICIFAIIASFVWTRVELGATNSHITNVESPCLRYGSQSKQCHGSFQAAIDSITDYQLCILLAKRPDLTSVATHDCVRIARSQHRRGTDIIGQSGAQPGRRSPDSPSPGQPEGSQPGANSAPQGGAGSGKSNPDHSAGNPTQPQDPASPESPDSPSTQGTAPSSPGNSSSNPPAASVGQPSPSAPESSPSKPPVVGVEAPTLPVQACVPGVVSVNCP